MGERAESKSRGVCRSIWVVRSSGCRSSCDTLEKAMVNRVLRLISSPDTAREVHPGVRLVRTPAAAEPQREHFERLGLAVAIVGADRVELTGCFAERVDIRVVARPPGEEEDDPNPVVWD